jgi:hypothetical protein
VLALAKKARVVKLGNVALDGTKVKANASKHKAMSYDRMEKDAARLRQKVKELLAAAEAADVQGESRRHLVCQLKSRSNLTIGMGRRSTWRLHEASPIRAVSVVAGKWLRQHYRQQWIWSRWKQCGSWFGRDNR